MKPLEHPHTYQKDSSWAWLVSLGAFVSMLLETGMVKSLGVLLPALRRDFSTHTWVVGLIISFMPGCGIFASPLAGAISKRFSSRFSLMAFGLLSSSGLMLGSFAISVNMLAMSLILTGFSIGAESVTLAVLSEYFDKYHDIANGIAHAGVSVGVMIMPLLTQFCLDIYGWRGTMLILGALNMHIVVCGAIMQPLSAYPAEEHQHDTDDVTVHKDESDRVPVQKRPFQKLATILKNISHYLDLTLFKDFYFLTLLWISTAGGYYYTGWLIYLVPHATDVGFSSYKAAALATVGGFGHLTGNIVFPLSTKLLSGKMLLYLSTLITSLALVIDPVCATFHSYPGLMLTSAVFGFSKAMIACSVLKVLHADNEDGNLANSVSWVVVGYSVGSIFSGYFSGWLFDQTGSYTISFLVLGAVSFLSLCPRFILDFRNSSKEKHYRTLPLSDQDSE